jgi:hypothetical protein
MSNLVPIPLDLFSRLKGAGLDVDAILRRAKLPRARFSLPRPQGTTAEFFDRFDAGSGVPCFDDLAIAYRFPTSAGTHNRMSQHPQNGAGDLTTTGWPPWGCTKRSCSA